MPAKIATIEKALAKRTVKRESGCWEWTGCLQKNGYGRMTFRYKTDYTHRWAWLATGAVISKGIEICHRCDNPKCVRPSHLFEGTRQENVDDAMKKGRVARGDRLPDRRGENGPSAKLTWTQVREIRELKPRGESARALALSMNISVDSVRKIIAGITWKENADGGLNQ